MIELLSNPLVDFVSRVVLPGLSVLVAIVAVVVLVFTLRRAGQTLTRSVIPQIECYLRARPSSHVFDFVIANFGLGSAYRVSFSLDADEEDFAAHNVIMKQRRTDTPFSIVEPGGQIVNMFGIGPSLLGQDPALKPFEAIVMYEWQPFWSKRRRVEKRHYNIDVRPFSELVWDQQKNEVAETLKAELPKIAKALGVTQRPAVPADRKSGGETFFRRIESLMPALFAEMRSDLESSPMKREFILMFKTAMYNAGRRKPLSYHYEDHEDLADKVGLLVNEGVVTDITYNSVDRYMMSEALVEYLERSAVETQR